jgi:hypothetical protein
MAVEEDLGALPRLVGAPAYARPPAIVTAPRPFDPDELPLESAQTEEERAFAAGLPARAFAPGGADVGLAPDLHSVDERATPSAAAPQPTASMRGPARARSLRGISRILGRQ